MSLILDGLSVWLPVRGTVLTSLSAEISGVTLVVGRSGAGATTLLRTLAGNLPPGARVAGQVEIAGASVLGLTADELGRLDATHLHPLPADVTQVLRRTDPDLRAAWGIDAPPTTDRGRAALRLAAALTNRDAQVLLLDQPLTDLAPALRLRACAAIRARAAAGATVVWAEHLLEEALPAADHVLELVRSDRFALATRAQWLPRTLPAPPAMALARALGLPREAWTAPEGTLADSHLPSTAVHLRTPRRTSGDRLGEASPETTRIDRPLDLHEGECVGVVSLDGDRSAEIDLARRLVAVARGEEFLAEPMVLPRATSAGALCAGWERRHRSAPGSVTAYVEPLAHLGAHRSVDRHSPGERAALTWALTATRPGARLLIDPTRGLDPAGRRHLARLLHGDPTAMTCLVSSDVEVLTRACHRLVLISGGAIVADGAPLAVLPRLPHLPQVARLGARALHVADLVPTPVGVSR